MDITKFAKSEDTIIKEQAINSEKWELILLRVKWLQRAGESEKALSLLQRMDKLLEPQLVPQPVKVRFEQNDIIVNGVLPCIATITINLIDTEEAIRQGLIEATSRVIFEHHMLKYERPWNFPPEIMRKQGTRANKKIEHLKEILSYFDEHKDEHINEKVKAYRGEDATRDDTEFNRAKQYPYEMMNKARMCMEAAKENKFPPKFDTGKKLKK